MRMRRCFTQISIPEQRLDEEARSLREAAKGLRPGPARDAAIRQARQMETASHINEWLTSPGLQSPR